MNSNARVTKLMATLINGEVLNTEAVCTQYDIGKRTFQRDLMVIKEALGEHFEIKEHHGVWKLITVDGDEISQLPAVSAICHILIGTRGLASSELKQLLTYLQMPLATSEQETLHKQLRQVLADYIPVTQAKPLLQLLSEVETAIDQTEALYFTYRGTQTHHHGVEIHRAQPVAVFFELHYFYVAMYNLDAEKYWLYRLDRIHDLARKTTGLKLDYATRFSLQDHWRYTYMQDDGDLVTFRFEYAYYATSALDAFPHSKVVGMTPDGHFIIEARAKMVGIMMWVLGQGIGVKVISPPSLIKAVTESLDATRAQYHI